MIIVNVPQGSAEWHAFRATKFTASDASAMLGYSKYKTRDQLLQEKFSGVSEEVSAAMQAIFDKGHKTEAMARELLEAELSDELYPVTGHSSEQQNIAASLDGMDMMGKFLFEHKLWNEKLADFILASNDLPDTHWPQVEQQLYVSGADYCEFVVSDGTKAKRVIHKYFPQGERLKSVLSGWKQFSIDLDGYEAKAPAVKVEGKRIDALPALIIEINGSVKNSNLATYKGTLLARIDSINTDLSTSQEFADAEAMVKFCKKAEDELKTAEKMVLGQVFDINEAIQTIADLAKAMRDKRLTLDKLVKTRKEQIKFEMIGAADKVLAAHIDKINATFTQPWLSLDKGGFACAIKGKKNVNAMQSAINDELARCKISVNERADAVRANLKIYKALPSGFSVLFPDLNQLINHETLAFKGLVQGRIAEFNEAKAAKDSEAQRQEQNNIERVHGTDHKPQSTKPQLIDVSENTIFKADDTDNEKLGVLLYQLKEIQLPECVNAENFDLVAGCRNVLSDMTSKIDTAIKKNNAAA